MTHDEIVSAIAEKTCHSKADVKKILNAQAQVITDGVKSGRVVLHPKLGAFSVREIPERERRNPRNGEKITKPACIKPVFKISSALVHAVA